MRARIADVAYGAGSSTLAPLAASELACSHPAPDVGDRIRSLLVGPDPDVRGDVAGAMVGGALLMIGAAPELER
jgi:hypothetical protein